MLEIGPGTGNLTEKILAWSQGDVGDERGVSRVCAVEADPRMVGELERRFGSRDAPPKDNTGDRCLLDSRLTVISGDVLRQPLDNFSAFEICLSNVPYKISSPLLYWLLELASGGLQVSVRMLVRCECGSLFFFFRKSLWTGCVPNQGIGRSRV